MASPTDYELFKLRRGHALKQFGYPVDSLLPLRLGQLALQKFRQYNDLYQIAGAYVSIGKYLNAHGRYTEALDTLKWRWSVSTGIIGCSTTVTTVWTG